MQERESSSPKFQRRAEHRRDELLDAALDLFGERGYAQTSVAAIARRAGLSKGAVYLYFDSKQAILEGLVKRALSPVAAQAIDGARNAAPGIESALKSLLGSVTGAMAQKQVIAVLKIVLSEASVAPEIAAMYRHAVFDVVVPAASALIEAAIARGEIRPVDPELTVRSIIGPIFAHVVLAEIFGVRPARGLALEALADNHLDILLNGLLAPTEPRHA